MFQWHRKIQSIVDCVEENLTEDLTLKELAKKLNYSTYYCTKQFHKYVGMSLRNYIYLRKISQSVIDLRDSKERIIDIAIKYRFSSQEAFTRTFVKVYGITPSTYRKMPRPLPLLVKRNVYNPYYLGLGEIDMGKEMLKQVKVSIQVIPEHKFIGIKNINTDNYFEFWTLQEEVEGLGCNKVCGILESIKSHNGQIGGWFYKDGQRGYIYGIEVASDYIGEVPVGMECTLVPESTYVVFHHPPYDYEDLDDYVYEALNEAMNNWNPREYGYEYNNELYTYQRHDSVNYGQGFCRPIKTTI